MDDSPGNVLAPVKYAVVIVAAGRGARMGGPPKQFRHVGGAPLVVHTLRAFQKTAGWVAHPILVVAGDQIDHAKQLLTEHGLTHVVVCQGGAERVDSVRRGFAHVPPDIQLVAIHDAARPLVKPELITRVLACADEHGAALPALPARDTIKLATGQLSEGAVVRQTIDRQRVYLAQTPQIFRRQLLASALTSWVDRGKPPVTDDAQLVELAGFEVKLVEGDPANFKVTITEDLDRLEQVLERQQQQAGMDKRVPRSAVRTGPPAAGNIVRVGIGYDVHRLVPGRRLILGGVQIDFELGLDGHSDADVLAHAIGDALLGAAALGDIGQHFPPNDERYKDADSLQLLAAISRLLAEHGVGIGSIDSVVICERPKLAPHVPAMRGRLAEALGLPIHAVSVKATTSERLGFTGRQEGIAAQASAVCVCTPN